MSSVCQMLRVQHQKLQTKENNLQNEIEDLQTKLASVKDLLQETQNEKKKTENLIWYYDKIALFSQIKAISTQIYSLFFGRAIEGEREEDDDTVDDPLGKPSKKKRIYKDIGFICFDPLPPPPNKDIKNKDNFV